VGVVLLWGHPAARPYVTDQRPTGLTPASNLSPSERRENFEALWGIIDASYAHFQLKSIDWNEIGRRYRTRLDAVRGDDDFYLLIYQLVNELKDTHSWLDNYRVPALADVAEMPIDTFRGRPFVVAGAKAGWEVVSVDGITPAEKMESLRLRLRACSSERAFQREAGRSLLAGARDEPVRVTLQSPEGRIETLALNRGGRGNRPPAHAVPITVTRQHVVHFGRLPSGAGYIQIESFDGRQEISEEFNRALESLRDTPALVLDIRDNAGGFGHADIVGRFVTRRTLVGFSYIKNGRGHGDFSRRAISVQPSGTWQYTRPVALLVNDMTGSASDLFALELRAAAKVVTVGTTTHGNLSGVAVYGVLPCGLVVRISNGYITDAKNRSVEVNGNVPDSKIEPDIENYLNGRDPVLDRAVAILSKQ
jgi:C-terminal processing protease CtpA/Prc